MQYDDILVSVIVPVYNIQEYIAKCVESILAQTYTKLEILLVNDGSTDKSREICADYVLKDGRIRLVDKENGGLSDARNCGIEAARGKYIVFIDGDDYVHRDYILLLLRAVTKHEADVALCSFEAVDGSGHVLQREEIEELPECTNGRKILSSVMTDYGYKYVVAWNKIYSHDLFSDIRFDKGRIYEDEYINFKLFWACQKVAIIRDVLYFYVQREGSITQTSMTVDKIMMKCNMHRERIKFYMDKEALDFQRRACQMYCNWMVECMRCYSDILGREERRKMQTDMREIARMAIGNNCTTPALVFQDILGSISLKLAAGMKSMYQRGKRSSKK